MQHKPNALATRLVHSRPPADGSRIHLATCRHVTVAPERFLPWNWSEGRDDDEWLKLGWFKPCRVCLPEQARRLAEAKRP